MKIRLAGTVNDSIVDGTGIRFTVFVQGCPHKCKGCHNPQTHDFNGGYDADTDDILEQAKKNPLLEGLTFSGGEPFMQPLPLCDLAKKAHKSGFNIFCYTGFLYEQLLEDAEKRSLLDEVDFLIDGPFIEEQKSLLLTFRGSKNQRIIDVKKSRAAGTVVLADIEDEEI
ncbi:MAG: anaerobic ribonucleoside-triphosphate reductase activating protein [Firmicutes bacterium]|nr:anaerobic ribonucleoside-triphosphate reductase activating protein [Bacillota bacterium]